MTKASEKTVLFLGTDNYYRSRFAEIVFNSVVGKMGLSWRAISRGLAVERSVNKCPMAKPAVKFLETMGIVAFIDVARPPAQVTEDELRDADLIVALNHAEHLPVLEQQFPTWIEKVECWQVDDVPEALAVIEREVMKLTARLIGGGKRDESAKQDVIGDQAKLCEAKPIPKNTVVRVGRETKGRRGKGVTIVSDVPLDEASLLELAAKLKQRCGSGGTVKDGRIEIQGDHRDRLVAELEGMGYRVKRAGG